MKRLVVLLVLIATLPVIGQSVKPVSNNQSTQFYLNAFLSTDLKEVSVKSFDSFLAKLEKKQTSFKNEKDFIRYVFSKTHQLYLKKYSAYPSFGELFTDGSYNCLTGTSLYATILNHFQFPFEVTETNYHIFLTVETKQGRVLLEATDPVDGFVESEKDIEKRITAYRQNILTVSNSKATYYQFNFDLFKSVSMEGLRGLLYYNKAVDSFNHQKLHESIQYLLKANELYHSSRIDELSSIILLAIQQSDWTDSAKEISIKAIHASVRRSMPAMASLSAH